ncbi:MAG: hypothetical protein OEV30_12750, partial [Ignavibacteria bacterium]|nr:hypothetical protein [Ignavibacteria bacterium]
MKRLGRYLIRFLLLVGVCLLLLAILLQTQWLRRVLADRILETVNASIHGRLETGEIRGTLYSTIDLRDVRLLLDKDTVAVAQRISISYEI